MKAKYISPVVEIAAVEPEAALLNNSVELDLDSSVWTGTFDPDKFDMQ